MKMLEKIKDIPVKKRLTAFLCQVKNRSIMESKALNGLTIHQLANRAGGLSLRKDGTVAFAPHEPPALFAFIVRMHFKET